MLVCAHLYCLCGCILGLGSSYRNACFCSKEPQISVCKLVGCPCLLEIRDFFSQAPQISVM